MGKNNKEEVVALSAPPTAAFSLPSGKGKTLVDVVMDHGAHSDTSYDSDISNGSNSESDGNGIWGKSFLAADTTDADSLVDSSQANDALPTKPSGKRTVSAAASRKKQRRAKSSSSAAQDSGSESSLARSLRPSRRADDSVALVAPPTSVAARTEEEFTIVMDMAKQYRRFERLKNQLIIRYADHLDAKIYKKALRDIIHTNVGEPVKSIRKHGKVTEENEIDEDYEPFRSRAERQINAKIAAINEKIVTDAKEYQKRLKDLEKTVRKKYKKILEGEDGNPSKDLEGKHLIEVDLNKYVTPRLKAVQRFINDAESKRDPGREGYIPQPLNPDTVQAMGEPASSTPANRSWGQWWSNLWRVITRWLSAEEVDRARGKILHPLDPGAIGRAIKSKSASAPASVSALFDFNADFNAAKRKVTKAVEMSASKTRRQLKGLKLKSKATEDADKFDRPSFSKRNRGPIIGLSTVTYFAAWLTAAYISFLAAGPAGALVTLAMFTVTSLSIGGSIGVSRAVKKSKKTDDDWSGYGSDGVNSDIEDDSANERDERLGYNSDNETGYETPTPVDSDVERPSQAPVAATRSAPAWGSEYGATPPRATTTAPASTLRQEPSTPPSTIGAKPSSSVRVVNWGDEYDAVPERATTAAPSTLRRRAKPSAPTTATTPASARTPNWGAEYNTAPPANPGSSGTGTPFWQSSGTATTPVTAATADPASTSAPAKTIVHNPWM